MSQEVNTRTTISPKLLLAYYLVIPACVLVAVVDQLLGGAMKNSLPKDPHYYRLFLVFFFLPHIIMSLMTFADREYMRAYRQRWTNAVPWVLGAALIALSFYRPNLFYLIYTFLTARHVVIQQVGVNRLLMKNPSQPLAVLGALLILIVFLIDAHASVEELPAPDAMYFFFSAFPRADAFLSFAALIAGLSALFYWLAWRKESTSLGRAYLTGNFLMGAACLGFMASGYTLFALLVPRVIHDCTAATIYLNHDRNRNREQIHNFVFAAARFTRLPVAFLSPLVAIGVANLLYSVDSADHYGVVMMLCGLMHYYTESFMWRRGSPHREHVAIAA